MNRTLHVAVCGNIGSGKTTLTRQLADYYGWSPFVESVDDNPYLRDFYKDMSRYSFHVQVFFLSSRFKQAVAIGQRTSTTIQDRTIYEDGLIFAANLYESSHLNERDYNCYRRIFDAMTAVIQPPDLLIYLHANVATLMNRIRKRGREYENDISMEYLENLNRRYDEWIRNYKGKVLVLDMDQTDFTRRDDFISIVSQLDKLVR